MKKMSKGLFQEMLSIPIDDLKVKDDDLEYIDISEESSDSEDLNDESANISLVGNPVYPRVFWGDSTKPHSGQGPFPEAKYVGDNIHTTYQGLLSYLG